GAGLFFGARHEAADPLATLAMTPKAAIPAATLVLVRDRPTGSPELLMVERAATMAFAAGMMVFPGGKIDSKDIELGDRLRHPLGGAIVAAVRETLEETAIPAGLFPLPSPELALELQRALLADVSLATLLDQYQLVLDPAALTNFTRWLPPGDAPRRFDTWFFVAAAPPGEWHPNIAEDENSAAEWVTASLALERDQLGTASVIFPTRCNLERLALHQSYAEIIADAVRHPPETISPLIEERDGDLWLTIPTGLGYPRTAERLDRAKRG
ncbi:MAG: NUDIX domain-containing protein, partial [Pseudomonadota bacterium]|nr:NUDIX domain-containing protein [Pseudomonadota bacterium]